MSGGLTPRERPSIQTSPHGRISTRTLTGCGAAGGGAAGAGAGLHEQHRGFGRDADQPRRLRIDAPDAHAAVDLGDRQADLPHDD
ncbi:hypothetical protein, partial [Bordetella bronchiseptica]|uniref:hypothetical protein n=1 Tax=Bordetella bronchiseptica TaxID=518 RepID=UPI003EDC1CBE